MRALLVAVAVALAGAGCASPRAVRPPDVPVHLTRVAAVAPAEAPRPFVPGERPDELVLDESHFHPRLHHALEQHLRQRLGESQAATRLALSRMSIKIKSMAPNSDRGPMAVAATAGIPPVHPGAALLGGLIAAAVIEGVASRDVHALVLVNLEGEFGGEPFAGFAYGPYGEDARHSIENAVLEAFDRAAESLRERRRARAPG